MKDIKGQHVETYLAEGLLALYPVYDNGDKTAVLTRKCRHADQRSIIWLVRKLASYYNLDLVSLRRECGDILKIRHNIALPFNSTLVLLPVKVRQAAVIGETTTGFVNMHEIKALESINNDEVATKEVEGLWLSRVVFANGALLETFNTAATLKQRQKHGALLLKSFESKNWHSNFKKHYSKTELIELIKEYDGDYGELLASIVDLMILARMIKMGCKF
jgi:hypothetical protein